MASELIQPDGRHTPKSYTHVARQRQQGWSSSADKAADDADGNLVGEGDLVRRRARPIPFRQSLVRAGARPDQVARSRSTSSWPPPRAPAGQARRPDCAVRRLQAGGHVLGVETLAEPGYLIEVEGRYRLPDSRPAAKIDASTLYSNAYVCDGRRGATELDGGWVSSGISSRRSGRRVADADETVDLGGALVTPGLVNTHHHLYQTLTARPRAAGTPSG